MKIHFLGIGGSGTSAIASIAKTSGFEVTGCDKDNQTEFTGQLPKIKVYQGHSADHLKDCDILALTPAILSLDPNNPEIKAAQAEGIKIMTWQQFMGTYLEKDKFVIAVSGTHGKSTTTALIGHLLEQSGFDPTVELGAIVPQWKSNFRIGKGKYFVTEADEFNDNFLNTKPDIAVITSLEMDHPEYFKDFADYCHSFIEFLSKTKKLIAANLMDKGVAEVIKHVMKQSEVSVIDYSKIELDLNLKIPGSFNHLNALAAVQVGLFLDIPLARITPALESFSGLNRRFELIGKWKGALVFSDFGHHPTEIALTLQALRDKYPEKEIYVIFQPHMFSRTKALFNDFVKVFTYAPVDQIYITDIYPSREIDTGIITSEELVKEIRRKRKSVHFISRDELHYLRTHPEFISENLSNTILFNLGAGDIDVYARKIVRSL